MPATTTYTTIVSDMQTYMERTDTNFVNQIPRLIQLAEWRIATDMKTLGYLQVEQGTFILGNPVVAKPAYWKDTVAFNYNTGSAIVPLLPRSYDYARQYWPQVTGNAPPRFYSDYDALNWLITPPPDQTYSFEVMSHVRIQPLDNSTQTNWVTANAPHLILYACLLEASLWLKNASMADHWEQIYLRALGGLLQEDLRRPKDRSEVRENEQ